MISNRCLQLPEKLLPSLLIYLILGNSVRCLPSEIISVHASVEVRLSMNDERNGVQQYNNISTVTAHIIVASQIASWRARSASSVAPSGATLPSPHSKSHDGAPRPQSASSAPPIPSPCPVVPPISWMICLEMCPATIVASRIICGSLPSALHQLLTYAGTFRFWGV